MPGSRIAEYQIISSLGAGGMGEVYRARDSRLQRDVALKVLPDAFAQDPDRLARFQREAQVLAAMNHSGIAQIYGLADANNQTVLVMELVEGPTLAERLAGGPLPIDEALAIAGQIAEAMEAAHEQGIIHRDLKPANVKVRKDGTVKLLDFGLAKALEPAGPPSGSAPDQPTITSPALTRQGVLLGTAAYMAPEQARGVAADRRADIWSYGCVLYEMLTGRRVFEGETISDTLAAVLRAEPDWSLVPGATPLEVRALLRRCLQKSPRQRLQAIGDARLALEEVRAGPASAQAASAWVPHSTRRLGYELAGALFVAAVAAFAAWKLKPMSAPPRPVTSFTIALPPGQRLAGLDRGTLALSPDGRELAYVATREDDDRAQIYVRAMETGEIKPVAGTEGGRIPFFSPDGQSLGFFADGALKKVPVRGGTVERLADATSPFGASWSDRHTIVFAPLYSVLERVSDQPGGAPQAVTRFDAAEIMHAWPSLLPDGQTVLFGSYGAASAGIAVQGVVDGVHRGVVSGQGVAAPSYLPSGHVAYRQGDNLMAVPFDVARKQAAGDAVLVVPNVRQYAVSTTGSLAYVSGTAPISRGRLTWVSRQGVPRLIDERADGYYQPRLDPVSGNRIAMDLRGQVWMFDLTTQNLAPFTFADLNQHAVWTRDARELVFMTQKDRAWQLSRQAADGSGRPKRLAGDAGRLDIPFSFTPEGLLGFVKYSDTSGSAFWVLPLHGAASGDAAEQRVFPVPTPDADAGPVFSPDGRWLAYAASDAAGRRQIYFQAYPGPGNKHQVSIDGGNEPVWNPDPARRPFELFYRSGDDMMAVEIGTQPPFVQSKPRRLFSGAGAYRPVQPNYVRANYDVSPDGQRFLMLQAVEQKESPISEIHVVLNWSEDLKRLAPAR